MTCALCCPELLTSFLWQLGRATAVNVIATSALVPLPRRACRRRCLTPRLSSGTTATTFSNRGDGEYYKLVGNVGYEITNNFDMLAEISYANIDFDGQNGFVDDSLDQTAGFLRFVRSF